MLATFGRLAAAFFPDLKGQTRQNDVLDLLREVIPVAYWDVVLLDDIGIASNPRDTNSGASASGSARPSCLPNAEGWR
jgi:hypothetical protein